ncbi:MAG: NADH:flavin oxidoreductase [Promethearchaeota archaeon]
MAELKYLFRTGRISSLILKNRIVRSATAERMASNDGYVTDALIKLYEDLAKGGTGLIITGGLAVEPTSTLTRCASCLFDDMFIAGQKRLVKVVHNYSECKIGAQIVHTGPQTDNKKYQPVGPSSIRRNNFDRIPQKLTIKNIQEIIKNFVDTGRRAYETGYDLIQLHASHGYLLSSFISPYFNRRIDEYGGNTLKRLKIIIDIYNLLRDEIGKSFPIIIKLQTQDFISGGLSLEEAKLITKIVTDTGFDAIEPSGGGAFLINSPKLYPSVVVKSAEDENYFLGTAKELKPIMGNTKLILVGGIKDAKRAEMILEKDQADFISMCRPLIREPNLPNRWKSGDLSPTTCLSCNNCFQTIFTASQDGLHCPVKKRKEKRQRS